MILRMWTGWTTAENAEAYETLLREEIFPGIAAKAVVGYRGIQLLRRESAAGEVEFVTLMRFDSWQAVQKFAGEDLERAYVPASARLVLKRFDQRSRHFELRADIEP